VRYCEEEKLYLAIRYDSNSRHTVWGSTNCNDRGVVLLEFLNSSNLVILNRGNDPTYVSAQRLEVIDITLVFFRFLESLRSWQVSFEPSL
jgi:hypothetical protein